MFFLYLCVSYVCKLVPYCDTSDETDTLSLETMLASNRNINYTILIILIIILINLESLGKIRTYMEMAGLHNDTLQPDRILC